MATSNEIAAFEGFKFGIGDIVRLRAPAAQRDYQLTAAFNTGTSDWTATPAVNIQESHIKGVVITRSLVQGNSGGIGRTYFVRGPSYERDMIFENELEPVPSE